MKDVYIDNGVLHARVIDRSDGIETHIHIPLCNVTTFVEKETPE